MKALKLITVSAIALSLSACATKREVKIESNIPAEVYVGNKKVGSTPLKIKLAPSSDKIFVKKAGYRPMEVLINTQKNYDRYMSSKGTDASKKNLTSTDLTGFLLEGPTYTVSGIITDPVIFFTGATLEYVPGAYYIELIPENAPTDVQGIEKIEIIDVKENRVSYNRFLLKEFAMINHTNLVHENKEYVNTASFYSGLSIDEIKNIIRSTETPVALAEELAAKKK